MFQYSFSETMPIFLNRLIKNNFILVRRTAIEVCQNAVIGHQKLNVWCLANNLREKQNIMYMFEFKQNVNIFQTLYFH